MARGGRSRAAAPFIYWIASHTRATPWFDQIAPCFGRVGRSWLRPRQTAPPRPFSLREKSLPTDLIRGWRGPRT